MKEKLILVGGGGHCKVCIDVIEQEGIYEIAGVLDIPTKMGQSILGYFVIGCDDDFEKYIEQGYHFFITVGQIKSAEIRKQVYQKLVLAGASIATVKSPLASISKYASIEQGTIIMHNVVVNAGAKIGCNCILNTGSSVEHDVSIGNNTHVSTGAYINGGAKIGNEVFVGSNSTITEQIKVGNNVIIGAGSVVIKNIEDYKIVAGVPSKEIKK